MSLLVFVFILKLSLSKAFSNINFILLVLYGSIVGFDIVFIWGTQKSVKNVFIEQVI